MTKERASLFGDAEIDISSFAPKLAPDADAPPAEKVREVAEAAHFRSREPKAAKLPELSKREPRRHRTGRNVQLNLKASQETVDAFYAINDKNGWVLGQTLEEAIHALQRELDRKQ